MQSRQSGLPRLPVRVLYVVAAVTAVAIASLACATLNQPLQTWRKDLDRRAELVREKLTQGPALRLEHAKQTREIEELYARVEEVTRRIPDQPREGEFLADLTRLAEQQGVAIDDFQRGAALQTAGYSAVSVSVSLRGSYRGICQLVEEISKLPRLAELTEIVIRRETETNDRSVSVTYALYYGLTTAGDASPDAAL